MLALVMTILLWILGPLVALFAILAAIAATKPDQLELSRAITINAPAEKVYPLIVNFHNWNAWSPWDKIDPNLERRFDGPEAGTGAHYAWTGNKKVGSGEMTITEATVPSRVLIKLHFVAPWETTNTTEFTVKALGAQCEVTWAMRGPSPFLVKLMGLLFNMEKAIGKDFESGLEAMKQVAEGS
jgi:uncharacterized protein YndB with AHSA1/START domain